MPPPHPSIPNLLTRNARIATTWTPLPLFSEMAADPNNPGISTVIICCADPRVCPEVFFDLKAGEAIVFRNPGGRVRPTLQGIAMLDSYVGHGKLSQLIVVHHTDCGASHCTHAGITEDVISRHPDKKAEVENWELGVFTDLEQSVRDDVDIARADPFLPGVMKENVRGFVFDVRTGRVSEV